ncbi:MAG: type II secretion system protein M [Gammaproteobacteria bacterium]|nr:type II secretion system protein M [Gammaproteobacteria bacterium]
MSRLAGLASVSAAVSALLDTLRARWQALSPRDQRALQIGGALVAAIVLIGGLAMLGDREAAVQQRIDARRALLAEMPMRLAVAQRAARYGADASLPLLTLARRVADTAGVPANIEPATDGGALLQLEDLPFDTALSIVADLEALQLRSRGLQIEATAPGRVTLRVDLAPRRP